MKLMRYGPMGQEKPALLDANGQVRDLSGVLADITADTLLPASLQKLVPPAEKGDTMRMGLLGNG